MSTSRIADFILFSTIYCLDNGGDFTTTFQEDALAKAVVVLLSGIHYVDPTALLNAKDAEMLILGPL
jgi:hypothetical protein